MSELLLLGTSPKTAPRALRERIALPERRADAFLRELAAHPEIREAVILSTCNRTELYVVVSDPVEAESAAPTSGPPSWPASSSPRATATPRASSSASPRGSSR